MRFSPYITFNQVTRVLDLLLLFGRKFEASTIQLFFLKCSNISSKNAFSHAIRFRFPESERNISLKNKGGYDYNYSMHFIIHLFIPMTKSPLRALVKATLIWWSSVMNPKFSLHHPKVGSGSILYSGSDLTKLNMT